jgi:hypothetical protein
MLATAAAMVVSLTYAPTPVSVRVSPTEKIKGQIDARIGALVEEGRGITEITEGMARLSRLASQSGFERPWIRCTKSIICKPG